MHASSDNIKLASEATLCYVDIDKNKAQLPEEMSMFPHLEAFTSEICAALDKYSVHVPNSESNRSWQVIYDLYGFTCHNLKLFIHLITILGLNISDFYLGYVEE